MPAFQHLTLTECAHLDTLIAETAAGSGDALSALYHKTRTAVYGFALSILKNPHDAEDVLQNVYVKIHEAAGSYHTEGKPLAWILRITRNLSFLHLRTKSRETPTSTEDLALFPQTNAPLSPEERKTLQNALRILSDVDRQIVMLHAVSDLRHREIADLLSLPLSTVLSKYHRALLRLRNALKED